MPPDEADDVVQDFVASRIIENIRWGMEAKDTKSLFLYFHYPCGVAEKFGHSLVDVLGAIPFVMKEFREDKFFDYQKIFPFFHIPRLNKTGNLEQNTYYFVADK